MIKPDETRLKASGTGWSYLRFAIAVLLSTAAVTKVMNTPQILAGDGLLSSAPRLAGITGYEAAAAGFLILGPALWTWRLTLVTFAVFTGSTIYAISTGQSCGCFGERFAPPTMLAMDAGVLILALVIRPARSADVSRLNLTHLAACILIGGCMAGASLWRHHNTDRTEPLEFLLADMLIGNAWPLNESVHADLKPLESGRWMALIVRRNCGHCRELVDQHFGDPTCHRSGERTAVFVAGSSQWPFQLDRISVDVPKDKVITWLDGEPFVASPAVFLVEDGTIVKASDGTDSSAFLEDLLTASD